jgi:hypothetical protein
VPQSEGSLRWAGEGAGGTLSRPPTRSSITPVAVSKMTTRRIQLPLAHGRGLRPPIASEILLNLRLRDNGMGVGQALIFVGHKFRLWHLRY